MNNLIGIVEGHPYGNAARRRLHESHWSNLLAWLIDPDGAGPAASSEVLCALCALAGIDVDDTNVRKVYREKPIGQQRTIDILICLINGPELYIENKVDRNYEDVNQLKDEIEGLPDAAHLILLCPRGESLLLDETRNLLTNAPRFCHVRWLDLAERLGEIQAEGIPGLVLNMIAQYWPERTKEDFNWLVEVIIEEEHWETFYADTFKDVFQQRFQQVWEAWVEERGERGMGGAHWFLTTKLAGLCQVAEGRFRLSRTGNSRAPTDPEWGYHEIYEYEVKLK